MKDLLKVFNEFQNMVKNYDWFVKVSGIGNLLFLGGIIAVILNRFIIHNATVYTVGFYSFLLGIIVLLGNASYPMLSQGLVGFGLYHLIFNVYQINGSGINNFFSSANLVESLIYIGSGYIFFKVQGQSPTTAPVGSPDNCLLCPKCSKSNPKGAKFCGGCGASMAGQEPDNQQVQ